MPTSLNSKEPNRIERPTDIYKAMLEISQSIMRLSDESELFPIICRTAVEVGGVTMAWVGKLNDAGRLIEPVASYGNGSEYLDNIVISPDGGLPEGCGPTGAAFRENRIVIINDYQMSEITRPWHERAARYGWKSAGTFPIQRGSRPFAVLTVYHSRLHAFDDETTNLLKELSGNVSFALDNLDRETQRIKALEGLRKSNEENRDLYNRAPCGYHSLDKDGTIVKINDTELAWLGYTRDEVVGKMKWPDLLTSASLQVFREKFPRFRERGFERDLEIEVIRKDGTVITTLINAQAIYDANGNYLESWTTVYDITERKRAEDLLHKSAEEIEDLYNRAPCGYHSLDKDGIMVRINDTELAWLGYARSEVIGKMKWVDLLTQNSLQVFRENFPRFKECGFLRDLEIEVIRRDGTVLAALVNATAIYDSSGNYVMSRTTLNDITKRKHTEEALRKSEERYRQIVETTNEGIWSVDAAYKTTFVNPALCRMLGYQPDEMLGRNLDDFLFDADVDMQDHQRQVRSRHAGIDGVYERRVRRKDGSACWCEVNATSVMNEQGVFSSAFAILTDITEKKKSEELIWRQANFDSLTGLPNRALLYDRLEQEIKKSHRAGLRMAVLFIDLDRFKEVNDTLGHSIGDLLLVEAAKRISGCVREADTVARLGGDEFTVILSELETNGDVERVTGNILDKLAEPFLLKGELVYLSASIGITMYPDDATEVEELLKDADQAMYVAKNGGRNRFGYFTRSMQQAAQARLQLANDLRGALAAGQFRVHFQPIMDLVTGRIDKAEALIRWQHPVRGMVSPSEFIPLAEETGLIVEIGDWMFKEAARQVKHWRALYNPVLQVSVNKSPTQFRQSGNNHEKWLDYLQELDLPGQSIVIEITEGLLLSTESGVRDKLLEFRDTGIQVSIDDFGTGYSSLSYLKKFDIDYLKIDQSFVRNLATDQNDMALSEAIIVMAHKLGLKVIAEGVETEAQRTLLVAAGCDYAQGYLFSRPLLAEEFEVLLGYRDTDRRLRSN